MISMDQIRKGMEVHSSDGAKLGKVAEVWLGTDPQHANDLCDEEVCSRVEVHRGLINKTVMYVPSCAIQDVSDKVVTLKVDEEATHHKGWARPPKWLAEATTS